MRSWLIFYMTLVGKILYHILWLGRYKVENAQKWYERSNDSSNYKLKLELRLLKKIALGFLQAILINAIASLSSRLRLLRVSAMDGSS